MGQRGRSCVQEPEPTQEAGLSRWALSVGSGSLQDWNLLVGSVSCADGSHVFNEGAQSPPRGVSLAWPWFSPNHLLDSN